MQNYNWNYPTTMWVGENRIKDLGSACKKLNINKPLLVTDNGLFKSKIIQDAVSFLKKENLSVEVFSNVVGNPTGSNVEEGVEFYKPKKMTFGLRLDQYRTLFVFEINREFYNKLDENNYDNLLNDISQYKFGFEHRFKFGSTIRMGLLYKEKIMNSLNPITQFTLGSNKDFNKNLNLDFALSYYITSYKYDDIFPVLSPSSTLDCSIDCETIIESALSISTTLKWKF